MTLGCFLVWPALGDMDALEQSLDNYDWSASLCIGNSNLCSGQWHCYIAATGESYDRAKPAIKLGAQNLVVLADKPKVKENVPQLVALK